MRELHRAQNNPTNYRLDNAPLPDALREDLNRAFESLAQLTPIYPVISKRNSLLNSEITNNSFRFAAHVPTGDASKHASMNDI